MSVHMFCVDVFVCQGVNLVQAREQGQLVFLEGLKDSVGQLLQQGPDSEAYPMGFLRYIQDRHIYAVTLMVCW